MEIKKIGQIAIPVQDMDTAIAFYRDKLELEYLFSAPPGLAFFMCGDVRLMLESNTEVKQELHSSVIYFRVSDIHQAYQQLHTQGVDFADKPHPIAKMPDHELWMAFFYDPDQNLLALMSEVPLKKP